MELPFVFFKHLFQIQLDTESGQMKKYECCCLWIYQCFANGHTDKRLEPPILFYTALCCKT